MYRVKRIHFAEDLEIFKYRPGGFIAPHTDYLKEEEIQEDYLHFGNIFAQGLLFVSKAELGGNFVMPLLGIAVSPEPGSLVVWHNVDRNGNFDQRYENNAIIPA